MSAGGGPVPPAHTLLNNDSRFPSIPPNSFYASSSSSSSFAASHSSSAAPAVLESPPRRRRRKKSVTIYDLDEMAAWLEADVDIIGVWQQFLSMLVNV